MQSIHRTVLKPLTLLTNNQSFMPRKGPHWMGSGIVPIEGAIVWLFAHSMEGAMIILSAWVNDAISSSEVLPVYEV